MTRFFRGMSSKVSPPDSAARLPLDVLGQLPGQALGGGVVPPAGQDHAVGGEHVAVVEVGDTAAVEGLQPVGHAVLLEEGFQALGGVLVHPVEEDEVVPGDRAELGAFAVGALGGGVLADAVAFGAVEHGLAPFLSQIPRPWAHGCAPLMIPQNGGDVKKEVFTRLCRGGENKRRAPRLGRALRRGRVENEREKQPLRPRNALGGGGSLPGGAAGVGREEHGLELLAL